MRILYADDQSDVRSLIQLHLERTGHHVVAVANGEEALRALREHTFDVLLLDEQMPGMTGSEVWRTIRSEQNAPSPVAIAVTGYDTEEEQDRLLQLGFHTVIGKPFHWKSLDATLRSLASGKAAPPREAGANVTVLASRPTDALARVGGDAELLARMARAFLRELPGRLRDLQHAIRHEHGDVLASQAHALKGSLSLFAADGAAAICKELQQLGKSNDFARAAVSFAALEQTIAELQPNLRRYAAYKRTSGPGTPAHPKTKPRSPGSNRT